ncbi:hypothetical protein G7054_g9696 [Neopestalotiopsis clavispora]|nr:hypothetical protein G7054_g9696 [Neopestalotiopsis clavispora]
MTEHIEKPLTLASGLTLQNRLVNAAMAENMADKNGLPHQKFRTPYSVWAKGGWGMVLTGNVEVDRRYLGAPGDIAFNDDIPYEEMLAAWRTWAEACNAGGTPTLVQINHPGRQSPMGAGSRGLFAKNLAPSAVPLNFGSGLLPKLISTLMFGTPKAMTQADIDDVFLSEKTNQRTDAYGGSPAARAKIVVEVIKAMREATPKGFTIGIKLNSADHQSSAELAACLEQLKAITAAGVDFIEISGGSYESPTMNTGPADSEEKANKSARTKAREAFFLEFAQAIRKDVPDVPLMVTGGFRTRQGLEAALHDGGCDLVGIGRPACVKPLLPNEVILNKAIKDDDAVFHVQKIQPPWIATKLGIKIIGAAGDSAHYQGQLQKIGQ